MITFFLVLSFVLGYVTGFGIVTAYAIIRQRDKRPPAAPPRLWG